MNKYNNYYYGQDRENTHSRGKVPEVHEFFGVLGGVKATFELILREIK
jgi:hypothetical protein